MKKFIKTVALCAMSATLLFSNIVPYGVEAVSSNYDDANSIEDCAANIKRVYKERYPEFSDEVDEIVDSLSTSEEFTYIFESEGSSAFQIIEESIRDAFDSEPMPLMQTDDLYTSQYSFPIVKQMNEYFCGPASTLMALIGSGASSYYYTNSTTILNNWQTALSINEMLNTNQNGTHIDNITKVLRNNITSVNGYTYKSKAFTINSYNKALNFVSSSLIMDAIPVLLINDTSLLSYYHGDRYEHYVVVNYVDFNAETVMIYDPHYDSRYYGNHTITFDEFNYLAENSRDLWMSVYTKASSDDSFVYN